MAPTAKLSLLLTFAALVPSTISTCASESPFFPAPTYTSHSSEIWETFSAIEASLSTLTTNNAALNTSSYSIEVTSSKSTLWSTFHTARDKNLTRPGAERIDGSSRYRIASITKVFTVLGILQQHAAGNLSLDDTVDKYVSNLTLSNSPNAIPWGDITLRSLASQLSGLPRDWAQGDLLFSPEDPTSLGLPPISPSSPDLADLPHCDSYNAYKPCTAAELVDHLSRRPPLFAPNQKSTYSNVAFELLGLVLANRTRLTYEQSVDSAILHPLGMSETSFTKPADEVAVLPKGEAWYFDVDEGVQNPTGGLYCSSHDMSVFLRHVLSTYADVAGAKMNWLMPVSFTASQHGFYGMPWEIFRTAQILSSARAPVTFYTKGGGLPGYRTLILLVPEYDLGITIFTAGNGAILDELLERVTVPLIRAAHTLAARQTREKYSGTFSASVTPTTDDTRPLNSTITLSLSATHGLEITRWISNATDVLAVIPDKFQFPATTRFHAQLIPTLRYRDETRRTGQKWRIAVTLEEDRKRNGETRVWEDFCTADVDPLIYAGQPVNEVVFWEEEDNSDDDGGKGETGAKVRSLELTAFRVNMTRRDDAAGEEPGSRPAGYDGVVVQEL